MAADTPASSAPRRRRGPGHDGRGALQHPQLVAGVVLIAVGADGSTPQAAAAFRDRAFGYADTLEECGVEAFARELYGQERFADLCPSDRSLLERSAARSHPQALAAVARGPLGSRRPISDLPGVFTGPALVACGALDRGSTPSHALIKRVRQARVVEFPGVGHAVHLRRPRALAALVATALRS